MQQAIESWLQEMRSRGRPIPGPNSAALKAQRLRDELMALVRQQDVIMRGDLSEMRDELSQLREEVDRIRFRVRQLVLKKKLSETEMDEIFGDGLFGPGAGGRCGGASSLPN